jgi:hypothetical protein
MKRTRVGDRLVDFPPPVTRTRALAFIWRDLKITGKAYRVPARTGSIAELSLLTERP